MYNSHGGNICVISIGNHSKTLFVKPCVYNIKTDLKTQILRIWTVSRWSPITGFCVGNDKPLCFLMSGKFSYSWVKSGDQGKSSSSSSCQSVSQSVSHLVSATEDGEFHNLYASPDIGKMKSWRMRRVGYEAWWDRWEVHTKYWSENLKGTDRSEDLSIDGKITLEQTLRK